MPSLNEGGGHKQRRSCRWQCAARLSTVVKRSLIFGVGLAQARRDGGPAPNRARRDGTGQQRPGTLRVSRLLISLHILGVVSMSEVTKRVTTNKASQDERSTHELGLNFLNKFSQSGVAVHVCSRQPLGLSSHRAAAGRICKVWWFPICSTLSHWSATVHLIRSSTAGA